MFDDKEDISSQELVNITYGKYLSIFFHIIFFFFSKTKQYTSKCSKNRTCNNTVKEEIASFDLV
jgi:hypothetical protein